MKNNTTQNIRLVDIFFIAPVLIYASTLNTLPPLIKLLLLIIGISTLIYNGIIYLFVKEKTN